MAFSKAADLKFTWIIPNFKEKLFSHRCEECSPKFTASKEPKLEWHLILSIDRYDYDGGFRKIDLKFVCDETTADPMDIKVNVSVIMSGIRKVNLRSLIASGTEKSFGFYNFIKDRELIEMFFYSNNKLEILVEMFLQNKEINKDLKVFTNLKFLSDTQISIDEQKFHAHKAFLAAKSEYFYNKFQENKDIHEIYSLDNIKSEAFKEILKYIYCGNIENWSLSSDILFGANFLQMEDLKLECEEYFKYKITADCVSSILALAVECNTKSLLKHCLDYILKNINKLGNSGNFQCLKTKPIVVLNILEKVFERHGNGSLTIVEKIDLSYEKTAMNTSCELLQEYEPFLDNESMSDITIHVDKRVFHSHKVILSAKCPVLHRMLMSNMKEALNNLIEINDINAQVFYEVLRYIYTGKVENLQEYGIEILKAADKYNLARLRRICEEFLAEELAVDNVVELVKIADTYNALFLTERCVYYIVKQMVSNSQEKKDTIVNTLTTFVNNHSNILYEILNVLSTHCKIKN